jgi:hypothetical protein
MVEYARITFIVWSSDLAPEEIKVKQQDFLEICSRLFSYSLEEVQLLLAPCYWYIIAFRDLAPELELSEHTD